MTYPNAGSLLRAKASGLLFAVLFFVATPCSAQEQLANEIPLLVAIEQDGRIAEVVDHTVTIEKKPFRLLFVMELNEEVSVHASASSKVFDLAASGESMAKILEQEGRWMGGAELLQNEWKFFDLKADETSWQGWYFGESGHLFNYVSRQFEYYICTREIENFTVDYRNITPIGAFPSDELYFVFTDLEIAGGYTIFTETRTVYVKIVFE